MAIISHRTTAPERADARRAADPGEKRKPLPYTVPDDFAIRDKAVPVWTGIRAVLGRPTTPR